MGNLAKKIRDEEDKKLIKKMTGKTPKHRCPICHHFSVWYFKDKAKRQCLMCEILEEKR